ncbi:MULTISPECIES: DEAD/DEAH box helicase [Pelotomaculum]|uniref:DEAD/DEAH box helicase n=1 Tax=Pelotomaculum TaxID=191373 RepID=UPI0009CD46A4|nr:MULTISPECIES: DEAD/DEAH box helicase [Pelotomaculum]OPX86907.1 MAG: DEAD-box ATP-dependent RNA helicase CshA [Pelotomaculum sp. PtaB.Bin117]OPY63129.1 MAG: DEAD-box ATP-dependent RNA helicase CshA [Pelotomaculum sp. PtaU1.Bin065]
MATFSDFGLTGPVLRTINNMGFEEATPIQERAIPMGLAGKDLIGQAHTGTGKTAAFGIPMVELFDVEREQIQGIVITPTRELAIQVAEELNKIGQVKGIRTLPVYGGQDITRQVRALKNRQHIIVGTPGRLMDHMRRKTVRLNQVRMVVLDEADEMLNMGFVEDIETILREVPDERQTLLFSATMPGPIQALARRFMRNPAVIRIEGRQVTVPNTEQSYIEVEEKQKFDVFCRLLDIQSPDRSIVFGRTKRRVDELSEALLKRGYSAEALHGDLAQSKRDLVMHRFKEGIIEVLVATDVAARGLDISDVTHIYNFDVPQDPEGYVHRIGRTGRAGKAGKAITFVTPREIQHLRVIENMTGGKIARKPIPTIKEAVEWQQRLAVDKLLLAVENGDTGNYKGLAEGLLKENDPVTLLAAALKVLTKEFDQTPVILTEERPLRVRQNKNAIPGQRERGYYSSGSSKKNNGRGGGFKGKNRFSNNRTF